MKSCSFTLSACLPVYSPSFFFSQATIPGIPALFARSANRPAHQKSRVFFGCREAFPRKSRAAPEENPGSFLSRRLETQNTSSSFRVSGFCGPRETENTSSGSGFSDRRNPKKCFGFPELICRDFLKSDRFLVSIWLVFF